MVFFHGVRLFGAKNFKYEVTLEAKNCNHKVTLEETATKVSGTYASECVGYEEDNPYGFDVLFSNPVRGKGMVEVIASIRGPRSYYGVNGK